MDYEPTPSQPSQESSGIVVLNVGGRKYHTYKATLDESEWFRNFLDRWDDPSARQPDGSFFVDADPDVFQHVLAFMRRPSTYPLFWTKEKGFDLLLYNKLAAEADYFGLQQLRDWIISQGFQRVVQTLLVTRIDSLYPASYTENRCPVSYLDTQSLQFPPSDSELLESAGDSATTLDVAHIETRYVGPNGDKKYFCPRGFENHLVPSDCEDYEEPAISCFRDEIVFRQFKSADECYRDNKGTVITTYRETKVDLRACAADSAPK